MSDLNDAGRQLVADMSARHGFSEEAVRHMLGAIAQGQGTQAQFSHWEFGGMGQWSMGGMIMIGDMFNNGLKYRVDGLCNDLSGALSRTRVFAESPAGAMMSQNSGWPADLGSPSSQGAQNDMRYAYFPSTNRLAISQGGTVTIYDTGNHQIHGFGQAQSGTQSLSFNSQIGQFTVADLAVVRPQGEAQPQQQQYQPEPQYQSAPQPAPQPEAFAPNPVPMPMEQPAPQQAMPAAASSLPADMTDDQIFTRIERLADLRDRGILSDTEFSEKKTELLGRL